MSNAPKNRIKLPKPAIPRLKDEIAKDYNQTMKDLAESSYLSYVYDLNVKNLNQAMVSLNQELKARNDLDAKESNESNSQQPQA